MRLCALLEHPLFCLPLPTIERRLTVSKILTTQRHDHEQVVPLKSFIYHEFLNIDFLIFYSIIITKYLQQLNARMAMDNIIETLQNLALFLIALACEGEETTLVTFQVIMGAATIIAAAFALWRSFCRGKESLFPVKGLAWGMFCSLLGWMATFPDTTQWQVWLLVAGTGITITAIPWLIGGIIVDGMSDDDSVELMIAGDMGLVDMVAMGTLPRVTRSHEPLALGV